MYHLMYQNKSTSVLMQVTASKGHIVELEAKRMGVDPGSGYALEWALLPRKKQDVQQVEAVTEGAKAIVLATDPDREGEGIAWHLLNHLQVCSQAGGPPSVSQYDKPSTITPDWSQAFPGLLTGWCTFSSCQFTGHTQGLLTGMAP